MFLYEKQSACLSTMIFKFFIFHPALFVIIHQKSTFPDKTTKKEHAKRAFLFHLIIPTFQ